MRNKQASDAVQQAANRASWMTIGLIAVTALFLWSSFELGRVSAWIPQVTLSTTLLFLLLQLAKEFVDRKRLIRSADMLNKTAQPSMLPALAWMGTMLIAVWLSGVSIGVSMFCLAYLHWHAAERWQLSVALALGLGLGVQFLFGTLLQIELYRGILLGVLL